MSEEIVPGIADEPIETPNDDTGSTPPEGGADPAPAGGIADDDPGEGKPADDKPAEKPEAYDLEQVEGFELPEENLKSFSAKCNELGLTKEQAQGILAWHKDQNDAGILATQQNETAILKEWGQQIQSDPEFGGAQFKRTQADAIRALREFDTDGSLRQILRETKMQFNPAVIKICARIGAAMGEHGFISADGKGAGEEKSLADRMFPDMK